MCFCFVTTLIWHPSSCFLLFLLLVISCNELLWDAAGRDTFDANANSEPTARSSVACCTVFYIIGTSLIQFEGFFFLFGDLLKDGFSHKFGFSNCTGTFLYLTKVATLLCHGIIPQNVIIPKLSDHLDLWPQHFILICVGKMCGVMFAKT